MTLGECARKEDSKDRVAYLVILALKCRIPEMTDTIPFQAESINFRKYFCFVGQNMEIHKVVAGVLRWGASVSSWRRR